MNKKITIIGAGISGLATAFWLQRDGYDVTVLEKSGDVGGTMETEERDGFLFDRGPNSGLETTPLIGTLVEETGLRDEMVYANEESNKRYVLRGGGLHALPTGPGAFLRTRLFSTRAKLRLLAEPFIGRSKDGYYQSVADFVRRRLGQEFLDYAINPFVAGVFAGKPEELSVKSAFPRLYRLEEVYGGLITGMIRGAKERKKRAGQSKQSAKMFSFRSGMQTFPRAIARALRKGIICNATVTGIERYGDTLSVLYMEGDIERRVASDVVIPAVPAFIAGDLVEGFDAALAERLRSIHYPPVLVFFASYEKQSVRQPLDGFGFLIPEKENKSFLGAIWSSVIFPGRAPEDRAAFTLFIGGSRSPKLLNGDREKLIRRALDEFQEIMRIKGKPVFAANRLWERSIPQYNLGYIEHIRHIEAFEKKNPGIVLTGNYRGGISVGDCVKSSADIAERVKKLF